MKRIVVLSLTIFIILSLTGCSYIAGLSAPGQAKEYAEQIHNQQYPSTWENFGTCTKFLMSDKCDSSGNVLQYITTVTFKTNEGMIWSLIEIWDVQYTSLSYSTSISDYGSVDPSAGDEFVVAVTRRPVADTVFYSFLYPGFTSAAIYKDVDYKQFYTGYLKAFHEKLTELR